MDDKAKSRNYFDHHSSTGINRNGYWSHDYQATTRLLIGHQVHDLIDIGCGNGAFLQYFKSLSPQTSLHGLDYSAEMVKRSRERLPEAEIIEGDSENMPLPDCQFDGVSCHMSIHHYPHPEKALQEMNRILQRGGILLINELTGPNWLIRLMNWSFQHWNTGDHAVYSESTMESMLREAGFISIKSQRLTLFSYVCTGIKE